MKQLVVSITFLAALAALSNADPISGVAARGKGTHTVHARTTNNLADDSGSSELFGDQSFYAGTGNSVLLSDTWYYTTDVYIGEDEFGNPIYETYSEQQSEYAYAEANGYGRFDRSENLIGAEVYASSRSESSSSGSYASAEAFAYSSGLIDVTFTLTTTSQVFLWSSVAYGDGNVTLSKDGGFILDSNILYGRGVVSTTLGAGTYQLYGEAFNGGGDFYVQVQSVPEPASMAAMGLASAALLRRRRK